MTRSTYLRKEWIIIAGHALEKTKSALMCAPAVALTLLAGYEGTAEAVEAGSCRPAPITAVAEDGSLEAGEKDVYALSLANGALSAIAYRDAGRLEGLFAPSVRTEARDGVGDLFRFTKGAVSEYEATDTYHGARARLDGRTRYEYVNVCLHGVHAGKRLCDMRVSVFVDGDDPDMNRGIATVSFTDVRMDPGSEGHCINVGRLPVC